MCYRKHLRQVRRAHHRAKAQQRAPLPKELAGFVALTRHPFTRTLTVLSEREVGDQVADTLRDALREHRRALKIEARQRRNGGETACRRGKTQAVPVDQFPALPPASPTD